MRCIQLFSSSAVFGIISLFFCLVVSISFSSGYKGTVLAGSISKSLAPFSELLVRREISNPDNVINSAFIATNPSEPSEPDEEETPPEEQPQQPQPPEPVPNPQPAPAPEIVPEPPIPRPLPKPQPVDGIDQSLPGAPVPVPPSAPAPVGLPPPIGPLPIIPVPLPASPSGSSVPGRRRPAIPQRVQPQAVPGFGGGNHPLPPRPQVILTGPEVSDYPDEAQIRQDIRGIARDKTVMYTEVGGSLYPVRMFAERDAPMKYIYSDAFDYGYTFSNGRSAKWYQKFLDDVCRVYSDFAAGTVWLVSKYPTGPEFPCSMWNRVEYPALQQNPDVTEIILVDYTDINRQRPFWTDQLGEIRNWNPLHKRETTVTPCPDADTMFEGYPSGMSVDLTPILGPKAGWAMVDIVQHQRKNGDVNSELDISILNTRGEQIGVFTGAIAVPGLEVVVRSQLPFAVRIVVPDDDNKPLQFKYGELSWDSNDLSKCIFDPWKSEVREGRCSFDY